MNQQPFFVVGMGRSGTTLLRLMLHHHPRLAIPYESGFLTGYQTRLAEYGNLQDDVNLRRLVQTMLEEPNLKLWDHVFDTDDILQNVRERSLAGVAHALYSVYAAAKGKARWGDKSDYLDRLHIIHEIFPSAQFIHIIRDGRDVASSVLKLSWGPGDIIRAAEWWNEHVWVARRVGAILGSRQYLEVRYEDLVLDAEHTLRRCSEFLGEDYSPKMLSYHRDSETAIPIERRHQHHGFNDRPNASRAYAWKREMNRYDVALFDRHAQRMLLELGYEVESGSVSRPRLALRHLAVLGQRYRARHARS